MGIPKASVCVWWERRGEEGGALEGVGGAYGV